MISLSKRIYAFLDKYACVSPNWDGVSEDEKYTSPDVYELLNCAVLLDKGLKPTSCWSEWNSGGYKPYLSKEGKEEHNSIVKEIQQIIKQKV